MDAQTLQIVNKAGSPPISTTTLSGGGLLAPYQAKQFLKQTFDVAPLTSRVRHVMHTERSGYIDKISIGRRILREKAENTDDGYRATISTSQIEYQTKPVRLPWEVTEETLRENIQGQSLAQLITDMMTTQLGLDLEDLYINGDESTPSTDPDYNFLKLNDGWIKQAKDPSKGAHIVDATGKSSAIASIYDAAVDALPEKYIRTVTGLNWIMHPKKAREWKRYLRDQVVNHGGIVDSDLYRKPADIPIIETPFMPEDTVLLTDPQNLIVVNTYSVKVREDRTSKEAIMMDKRFYVTHLDADAIYEELEAVVIITNLGA